MAFMVRQIAPADKFTDELLRDALAPPCHMPRSCSPSPWTCSPLQMLVDVFDPLISGLLFIWPPGRRPRYERCHPPDPLSPRHLPRDRIGR